MPLEITEIPMQISTLYKHYCQTKNNKQNLWKISFEPTANSLESRHFSETISYSNLMKFRELLTEASVLKYCEDWDEFCGYIVHCTVGRKCGVRTAAGSLSRLGHLQTVRPNQPVWAIVGILLCFIFLGIKFTVERYIRSFSIFFQRGCKV